MREGNEVISSSRERTFATFPYRVNSASELPAGLRTVASSASPAGLDPDFIFVAPADVFSTGPFSVHQAPQKALLFARDGVLWVQAQDRKKTPAMSAYIRADSLLYLRSVQVLLYGRLELWGLADGTPGPVVVEYSTVGFDLLWPSLQRLLRLATGASWDLPEPGGGPAYLNPPPYDLPYKFMQGIRLYAAQEDETISGAVFQPAILVPRLQVFRRQITAPSVLVLTDRCVVLIEEQLPKTRKPGAYGWSFTYIPLATIEDMRFAPHETLSELTVRMRRGPATAERRLILEIGIAEAWRHLWATYAGPGQRLPQGMEL